MIPFAANALSVGKKTPKTAPSSTLDFVTLLEKDQATAIGNMHRKIGKIARVVPEVRSRTDRQTDRQTHRQTQTYSSQYFNTAPAGEETRRPASADRTARAANLRRDLEAT